MFKNRNSFLSGIFFLMIMFLNSCNFIDKSSDPVFPTSNNPPSVSLAANIATGNTPLLVNFAATVTVNNGSIIKYEWDFDNNGVYDSTTTSNLISYAYDTAGIYTSKVRVTDNTGTTAEVTAQFTVGYSLSVSLAANPALGVAPLTVNFTANSTYGGESAVKYEWDFDNNGVYDTTTTGKSVSHIYSIVGIYTSKVRVTDNVGVTAESTVQVTVTTPVNQISTISFTPSGIPSDNTVYLEQVAINNDEITLAVRVKGGTNVYGAAMEITYDSSKINYISISQGNYLGAKADTAFYASLINGQKGILLIGIDKKGNVPGTNGDGTLVTIVFRAVATQTNTAIGFNIQHSVLKSPNAGNANIPGTLWIGGSLSYN
ncbi:MAG: PKD domain-containing protein [bacterium]|nr:PKD domain-containing protein [bacterium]